MHSFQNSYKKLPSKNYDPSPSASAAFRLRKIRSPSADPKYSADADTSAIRTSLVTANSINSLYATLETLST